MADWRLSVAVKKIERRTYSEASGRAATPLRLGALEGGRPERPARKVTRTNDFKDLGALLRNFFRGNFQLRRAPKDEDGRPTGPIRFMPGRRRKTAKTKRLISRGETKRFAGHGVSH